MFDASWLSTSATITQVAEAFAMPEMSTAIGVGAELIPGRQALSASTKHVATNLAAAIPTSLTTPAITPQQLVPQQVSDPSALASLTGLSLLQQLALLDAATIADFVSANPAVVQALIDAPPAAREVQLWWTALGVDSRSDLMTSAPSLVGNLEGVPYGLRDAANRTFLSETMAQLSFTVNGGRSEALDSINRLRMLEKVSAALEVPEGTPARSLLTLDPSGAGTASIAIGDVGTADYVSILVPGMFYTVDGQMAAWTAAAEGLHDEQVAWIATLGESEPALAGATVATIAWIGYETPSLVNFVSLDLAYEGSEALALAVDGLHTLRGNEQPYVSVVAHSYGSTAAMMALTDYGIDIDAIGIIGSPGSSAQLASDLGVLGDNVYVGEADWDQVKDSAFFGSDPGSASFGAHRFRVAGGTDPLTGEPLLGSTGHDEYLMPGSESLRNLALVCLGQGRLVTMADESGVAKGSTGYEH